MVSIDGDVLAAGTAQGDKLERQEARISVLEEALVSVSTDVTVLEAEVSALSAVLEAFQRTFPGQIAEAVRGAQARRAL